ncbi:MAG: hypothetical protein ACI9CZ_000102 [Flavobacterium sp.]|jgi:hypothetical protein
MIKFDCKIRKYFYANQAFLSPILKPRDGMKFRCILIQKTQCFRCVFGLSLPLASSFLLAASGQAVPSRFYCFALEQNNKEHHCHPSRETKYAVTHNIIYYDLSDIYYMFDVVNHLIFKPLCNFIIHNY